MLNDLLKCSVWIIQSQLDGNYVPGISELMKMNKPYVIFIEVHLKCPYL